MAVCNARRSSRHFSSLFFLRFTHQVFQEETAAPHPANPEQRPIDAENGRAAAARDGCANRPATLGMPLLRHLHPCGGRAKNAVYCADIITSAAN